MPICASFSSAVSAADPAADDELSAEDADEPEALEPDALEPDEDELEEEPPSLDDAVFAEEADAAVDADAAPEASLETSDAVSQAANSAAAANSVRRRWIILVSRIVVFMLCGVPPLTIFEFGIITYTRDFRQTASF